MRPRDGRYKINSLKGRANGELNSRHANNSPKGWIAQKQLSKGTDGWRVKWSVRS